MTELFVSYSRDDSAAIEPIIENLRRIGFNLWIDIENLKPGTRVWMRAIEKALKRADGVLAFLSPTAKASEWCNIETSRAKRYGKQIYPVLLSGEDVDAVPIHLETFQYTDMRGRANRERNLEQLIETLAADFNHIIPDHDVEDDPEGNPIVHINVPEHHEGNISTLVIMGDNLSTVNMAGGNINTQQQSQIQVAPPSVDPIDLYRQAISAREAGQHAEAVRLLQQLQQHAPDILPQQVERLIADSQPYAEQEAHYDAYMVEYRYVSLLALDHVTHDEALRRWQTLRKAYPDIDADPDGFVERLRFPSKIVRSIIGEPFDWVDIPAGQVTLENHMGTHHVEAFQMAKYAITNAQFDAFINQGYDDEQWWRFSDDAWQWYQRYLESIDKAFAGEPMHPRVKVNWYEAVAFCLWLSEQSGQHIVLPTEQQWQRAGQGDDGRSYAWGHEEPTATLANWNENVGQTTPVDSYQEQAQRSPFGLYNMTGNVWEWCATGYKSGSQDITANVENRVLRGGSWYVTGPETLRLASRYYYSPRRRYFPLGFRVARLLA